MSWAVWITGLPDSRKSVLARVAAEALRTLGEPVKVTRRGNHYLEVQVVRPAGIHDPVAARVLGVGTPGQVCVMLHCGSRGFGHQIGTDYLRLFDQRRPGLRTRI